MLQTKSSMEKHMSAATDRGKKEMAKINRQSKAKANSMKTAEPARQKARLKKAGLTPGRVG